jgi:hypothetical protein
VTKDQKQIEAQKAVIDALQETISAQERTILAKTNTVHALMDLKVMLATKESADLPKVTETYFGNIKIRPEVAWFAGRMEQKLRANDHKGGWEDDYLNDLFKRLLEEVEELRREVKERNGLSIIDEAADVANFCLFIADRCRE